MRIAVAVKHARTLPDEARLTAAGDDVDPSVAEGGLNEWDAFAAEEALRLRDEAGGEVVAYTAGPPEAEAALRHCLAMGVDRAVRVECDTAGDPFAVAAALAEALAPDAPDLVLCGVQTSDAGNAATGVALAERLGYARAAVVTRVSAPVAAAGAGAPANGALVADRELEGGLVAVTEIDLPAVLTIQSGINVPRYAPLRAIRAAADAQIVVRRPAGPLPHAHRVRSLAIPGAALTGEPLGEDPREIARRILELVAGR
jgi:electron transfer flavoprotein beta subunit